MNRRPLLPLGTSINSAPQHLGGEAPFGYLWYNGQLVPHPEESVLRRKVFELFTEHRRKKAVARVLNDAGQRTRQGSLWSDVVIDRILRDPIAIDVRRANYTSHEGPKRHATPKPEFEWQYQSVEPIISEELWSECQHILSEGVRHKRQASRPPIHLFAGLAYCACGEKMYVPSNMPKYVCQHCRTKIPIVDLEGIFCEQLRDFHDLQRLWPQFEFPAKRKVVETLVDRIVIAPNEILFDLCYMPRTDLSSKMVAKSQQPDSESMPAPYVPHDTEALRQWSHLVAQLEIVVQSIQQNVARHASPGVSTDAGGVPDLEVVAHPQQPASAGESSGSTVAKTELRDDADRFREKNGGSYGRAMYTAWKMDHQQRFPHLREKDYPSFAAYQKWFSRSGK